MRAPPHRIVSAIYSIDGRRRKACPSGYHPDDYSGSQAFAAARRWPFVSSGKPASSTTVRWNERMRLPSDGGGAAADPGRALRVCLGPHWQTRSPEDRSEEHTSELQSLMRISYAVFC